MKSFKNKAGNKVIECGYRKGEDEFKLFKYSGVFEVLGQKIELYFTSGGKTYPLTKSEVDTYIQKANAHSDILLNKYGKVQSWTQETDNYNIKYVSEMTVNGVDFAVKAHLKLGKGKGSIKYAIRCSDDLKGHLTINGKRFKMNLARTRKVRWVF